MMTQAMQRFMALVGYDSARPLAPGVSTPCLIWLGARTPKRQPQFHVDGRTVYAHAWAWEQQHGPRPPGEQLTPRCGESMCVEPTHRERRPRGSHPRESRKR